MVMPTPFAIPDTKMKKARIAGFFTNWETG
jgi:hypothetical protein